jgi:hypothetical protein
MVTGFVSIAGFWCRQKCCPRNSRSKRKAADRRRPWEAPTPRDERRRKPECPRFLPLYNVIYGTARNGIQIDVMKQSNNDVEALKLLAES